MIKERRESKIGERETGYEGTDDEGSDKGGLQKKEGREEGMTDQGK